MKLTTIRRHGEAHPAVVITNTALRAEWCLDLTEVNGLLDDNDWGVEPIPDSGNHI